MSDRIIGSRFEIVRSIGQGGMGDVYLGLDRSSGDTVAIKLLKPDIVDASPELIERFEREGEALRQLDHPNIVKMLASVDEDGLHYLVMQYVGGGSLRDLLDRDDKLPVDRVLAIALELADALTRAHHLRIIHRDLKPANVLLAEDGTPRLTDFGVARMISRTRVTETGSVIGTYAYLSPEACRGEDLDPRTDIWSFGVLLFEMLAGRRPFDSEQATAILLAIINDPMPDLRMLRPDAPEPLVALIEAMLEKDREARLPSVRLAGAVIEGIMQGVDTPLPVTPVRKAAALDRESSRFATPTPDELVIMDAPTEPPASPAAAPPAATTRLARGSRSRWLWAGVLALLAVIALGIGLLASGALGDNADTPLDDPGPVLVAPIAAGNYMVLVAEFERLGGDERNVARFIAADLTERLEQSLSFSNLQVRAFPRVITSADDARAAAETNAAAVIVWGNYTADEIEARVQLGSLAPFPHNPFTRAMLERTANVRVSLANERRDSLVLPVLSVFNILITAEGDAFEVSRNVAMVEALHIGPEHVPPILNADSVAEKMQHAVATYLDDDDAAISYYDQAIARDEGNPMLYLYRAMKYARLGSLEQALVDIESAQRLMPAGWALPAMTLANIETSRRNWQAAIDYTDETIAINPDDWFAINYRGALYYLAGDYAQARADLEQAIELGAEANFPYMTLSMIAVREGHLVEAQQLWNEAVTRFSDATSSQRIVYALYGDEFPLIFGSMLDAIGNVTLGQYQAAIAASETALAIDPELSDMYLTQGTAYCSLGDYAAAKAAYDRAIALDPDFILLYGLRAEASMQLDDMPAAYADRALVEESALANVLIPLMDAGLRGEYACDQFFSFDYAALLADNGAGRGAP